jgi:F-type H+-transporting ATPase subunit a
MQEHEAWPAALLNRFLAGPADSVMNAVGLKHDPAHPWSDWLAFELIVFLFIIVLFAFLRPRLSVDKPGALQHIAELIYNFVGGEASDNIDRGSERYVPFFGTLFIFILFMNLIGIIPGFESPTMTPAVPAGLAIATFLFYNWTGIREHGAGRYLAHFAGPMPVLAPLMIPIEFISHLARPLSLTIRLYANMFAGEKVTLAFLGLTYLVVPSVFMGLHVFVSFLQAYIFTLLTIIYVSGATAHEH